VAEGREPRWPGRIRWRLVASGEHAPHHILVDGNLKGQRDLLRDPWTSPRQVPPFHVDDSGHHFLPRSLWTWLCVHAGREQQALFPLGQRSMKSQER
jgi:hypothetical protein